MTTPAKAQLSASQQQILNHAAVNTDGKLVWFPETIKGGARKKVLDSLFNRALITTDGTHWFVAAEGYEALGISRRAPITQAALDAVIESAETSLAAKPRTPENILFFNPATALVAVARRAAKPSCCGT